METSSSSNHETDHHKEQCSNRKRSSDFPMESPQVKRPDRMEATPTDLSLTSGQVVSIYERLVSNEKLTSDSLRLFGKIIKSCHPSPDTVILMDPLWFNTSDQASKLKPKDFDDAGRLAFPVHHNGHWTLCVAYLRHSEPKWMNVYHYDSMQNEERYNAVCAHFRKWIEKSELDYNVIFKRPCSREGQAQRPRGYSGTHSYQGGYL